MATIDFKAFAVQNTFCNVEFEESCCYLDWKREFNLFIAENTIIKPMSNIALMILAVIRVSSPCNGDKKAQRQRQTKNKTPFLKMKPKPQYVWCSCCISYYMLVDHKVAATLWLTLPMEPLNIALFHQWQKVIYPSNKVSLGELH